MRLLGGWAGCPRKPAGRGHGCSRRQNRAAAGSVSRRESLGACDVIRGELDPLPERSADQLARETDPQRITHALQVAHGEALGRIVGRLETMDDQARGERAEAAPRTPLE